MTAAPELPSMREWIDVGSRSPDDFEGGASEEPSVVQVVRTHLDNWREGRLEADLGNYAPDVLVLSRDGPDTGHEAVRRHWAQRAASLPGARFEFGEPVCADDLCLVEWTARGANAVIEDGAEIFMVRDGAIVAQISHYTVRRH